MESQKLSIPFYITVGLIAGAIIAYQIGIMRVFSVGTWSHFGSLVVSMAMLGFGVMSAVIAPSRRSECMLMNVILQVGNWPRPAAPAASW